MSGMRYPRKWSGISRLFSESFGDFTSEHTGVFTLRCVDKGMIPCMKIVAESCVLIIVYTLRIEIFRDWVE